MVNELRSHSVHAAFMESFTPTHTIKVIPLSKMDETYQHPNIQIFHMRKKRANRRGGEADAGGGGDGDVVEEEAEGDENAAAV